MLDYFERLRREDPVHFNESEVAGRYWSLTRYKEIKAVDTDHKNFSSAHGITLGFPIDQPLPEGALDVSMFIAMDQPKARRTAKDRFASGLNSQLGWHGSVDSRAYLRSAGFAA
jgi:cytochrome P450